ncbi:MAG: DUF7019 family protein [Streptosporangiaceae bacterium]
MHFSVRHLSREWKPVAAAGPGDYLHAAAVNLTLRALPTAPQAGTAAWLSGVADDGDAGRTLLALTGPIEDCLHWATASGARLPVPTSSTELVQLLQALARGQDLAVDDREMASGPDGAATALARRLSAQLPGFPLERQGVLARVVVHQPGPEPFGAVVVGVPLWVRRS